MLTSLLGQTIDNKVRLEALIGKGGMGAVFRGTHLLLDRPVAVKVLRPEATGDPQAVDRFFREARTSARIEHPNVVTIHDFGILSDGSAYLVMELIEGQPLRTWLQQGALPLEVAFPIIRQVCAAVEAAHRKGIIHRDLKPENIMMKEGEQGGWTVKVLDFGLAKLAEGSETLTKAGEFLGTPLYMSPEQCDSQDLNARSDIYSLGVVFYEILVGHPPFRGRLMELLKAHMFTTPEPPHQINPDLPVGVSQAILQALEKSPETRPETAGQFLSNLEAGYGHHTTAPGMADFGTVAMPALSENVPMRTQPNGSPGTGDPQSFQTVKDSRLGLNSAATPGIADPTLPLPTEDLNSARFRARTAPVNDDPQSYETVRATAEQGKTLPVDAASTFPPVPSLETLRMTDAFKSTGSGGVQPETSRRRAYVAAGAAAILLGTATIGGWAFWGKPQPAPQPATTPPTNSVGGASLVPAPPPNPAPAKPDPPPVNPPVNPPAAHPPTGKPNNNVSASDRKEEKKSGNGIKKFFGKVFGGGKDKEKDKKKKHD